MALRRVLEVYASSVAHFDTVPVVVVAAASAVPATASPPPTMAPATAVEMITRLASISSP
ncbi:hypothetical protein KRMM14A1004_03800 [Krasilnikovia sp. MM14-A1004]